MNNNLEQLLLLLYFPKFKSHNCSRFESFFRTIQKKENPPNKGKIIQTKTIFPDKIIRNEDKRTSLMIKGIPSEISKKEIRNIIEKYGNINYLYVTKNINSKEEENSSIVYLNVINYRTIISLYMNLRNCQIYSKGKLYNLKLMYTIAQGKKQLKQYIKNINVCKNLE